MKICRSKRLLSLLLVLTILMGIVPAQVLAAGPDEAESPTVAAPAVPETGSEESAGETSTVYYEVRFALPDVMKDLTEDELETVWLPETALVPAGTRIAALPSADRIGYVFSGWYYDAALEKRWAENDVVNRNMTLYPHFISLADMDQSLAVNYISDQDVASDFPVWVAAYDLTEEEVRALITVRDLSEFGEPELAFALERRETDPAELIDDEEKRGDILAALERWRRDGGSLGETLRAAGADDKTAGTLQAHYAADELRAEAETTARAALAGLGYGTGEPTEDLTAAIGRLSRNRNAQKELALMLDLDADAVAKAGADGLWELCVDAALRNRLREDGIRVRTVYRVRPAEGWPTGHLTQLELAKTDSLRYIRNGAESGEHVIYYNMTAAFEPFNNMRLRAGMIYIPYDRTEGVDLNDGLFKSALPEDEGDMTVERNDAVGEFTCLEPVKPGDMLVIYDGELREDGSADRMGYYRVTADLGGDRYAYEIPRYQDVVFIPDVIPVRTDGSYEDGVIVASADQFDFTHPALAEIGLTTDTVVEVGDWIALYDGSLDRPDEATLVGYGELTEVKPAENGLALRYALRTEDDMAHLAGMAMRQENVPLNLTDEEMKEIEANAIRDLEEKGFMDQAMNYVASTIFDDVPQEMETQQYRDAIQAVRFTTDDGKELTLDEVRKLNLLTDRITETKHAPLHVRFTVSAGLKHFSGQGVRFELSASSSWRYNFEALNEDTKDIGLTITILVQLEQEFALGIDMDFSIDWKKVWFIKYPKDVKGSFAVQIGTFTALGFEVTIATKKANPGAKENTNMALIHGNGELQDEWAADPSQRSGISEQDRFEWTGKLLNATAKLDNINAMLDLAFEGTGADSQEKNKYAGLENPGNKPSYWGSRYEQNGTVGGSIEEKYASFVSSKAEYVPFWSTKLLNKEFAPDPLHLCAIGLVVTAHASVKLCVVFGMSASFGLCKRWEVKFKILAWTSETSAADLEAPNFNAGIYLFGMIGLRVGLIFDFRVGLISTKLDSIGAVLEFGLYAELYGFVYFGYRWVSGRGGDIQFLGTLLFEIGFYMNVKLKAQVGNDRKKVEKEIVSMRVPLIDLGAPNVFLDFNIDPDDDKLDLKTMTGNSVQLPSEVFEMKAMGVATGKTDGLDMNGADRMPSSQHAVRSYGRDYKTYDEDFFEVTCVDTDEDGQSLGTCSWTYDPATDTLTVRPKDDSVTELWGEVTVAFRNPPADMFKSYAHDKRFGSYCNYGVGFALNGRNMARTLKVHWVRKTAPLTVENYYQICPDMKLDSKDQFLKLDSAGVHGMYSLGDTVKIDVPCGIISSLSLADQHIRTRTGAVPVAVYSHNPFELAGDSPASETIDEGPWKASYSKGPNGFLWVDDPAKRIWQNIDNPAAGRTIRIFWNDPAGAKHVAADPAQENVVEPTCTAEGSYDLVVRCKVCKKVMSEEHVTVPMLPHSEGKAVKENVIEPTCTAEGSYDEVVYCEACKAELSRTARTVPAKGHVPGDPVRENVVEPSCTEDGTYEDAVYCTVCEAEVSRIPGTIPHKGHVPGSAVKENVVDPTCTEPGSYDDVVYCTVCRDEVSRTHRTVDATGHTPGSAVKENVVDPTCTEPGSYDDVVYCTVCRTELSRTPQTVPALDHDWHVTETEAAPIMEDGKCTGWEPASKVTACSRCDEQAVETFPVDTAPAVDAESWAYTDGVLSVNCPTGTWAEATVADYLAGGDLFGYAGTLNASDCFTVPGSFAAEKGGDTVISDHPDETLTIPVTFTPVDTETYAACSFTMELKVVDTGIHYVDEAGTDLTALLYSEITVIPTDGTARGWYAVTQNYTLSERLVINGNVNLILCSGCTLTCPKGIQLSGGSLTVWGQSQTDGVLDCASEAGNAAIGGGSAGPMGGSLTVHSGKVLSLSSSEAAGIGGGRGQSGGTVTILGGYVQTGAMGGDAVAIGAGNGGTDHGSLTLGDELMVEVGNLSSTGNMIPLAEERVAQCHECWTAVIMPCSHPFAEYKAVDHETHVMSCNACYHKFTEEPHQYGEDGYTCTVCGDQASFSVYMKWHVAADQSEMMMDEQFRGQSIVLSRQIEGFDNLVFRGWNIYENASPFDVDGYLPAEGKEIIAPTTPVRVDCSFVALAVFGTPCIVTFAPGAAGGSMEAADWYIQDPYPLPDCSFEAPEGATFAGWKMDGADEPLPAGKTVTLSGDTVLTAAWQYSFGTPDMTLPTGITEVAESAFEGMPVKAVWIGDNCASVGANAFRDCPNLIRLRLPKDCAVGDGALEGCDHVVIFAPAGGTSEAWARTWIETHPTCDFQAE